MNKFYIPATRSMCMFSMIRRINRDYLHIQHVLFGYCAVRTES